jgi:hypothetical protein
MPKALQHAGFEVAVLSPSDVYVAKTKYVDRKYTIPSLEGHIVASKFTEAMHAFRPDLIIVGDERVLWFLHRVVRAADEGKDIGLDSEAIECVRRSLPHSGFFHASTDKYAFRQLANRLGVRVPGFHDVVSTADALTFAEEHGYPVVFKSGIGTGGAGVSVCNTEEDLAQAVSRAYKLYIGCRTTHHTMTVERFVTGQICSIACVAYQGEYLAGAMCDKTECYPPVTGPSTVRRYFDLPEMHEFARRIISETGFSGFCGFDFMVEDKTGLPIVIEWNPRITSPCSLGKDCGVDFGQALMAKMKGDPVPAMSVKEGWMVALYPQELVRDPQSMWVNSIYHDIPQDDPELLAAYETYIKEHRPEEKAVSSRI